MVNCYCGNLPKYMCLFQREREKETEQEKRGVEERERILMKLGECFIQIANSVLTLPKFFAS